MGTSFFGGMLYGFSVILVSFSVGYLFHHLFFKESD